MIKDSSEITKPMSIKTNVESKPISQKQWLAKSEERETILYETVLSKIKSSIILLLSNI